MASHENDARRSVKSSCPKLVKPKHWIRFWKIRKGDEVYVLSGKDKRREGTVLQTDFRRNMLKVSGCNLRKAKSFSNEYVRFMV